jgi:hypothetical protein
VSTSSNDDLDLGQTIRGFAAGQKLFGRFSLVRILGRGGMGVVWLARDEDLARDVALKFLPELIIHDKAVLDDLKRETNRSLELTHHNIVRIYDFVQDGQSACISMEYVDGATLSALRIDRANKVFEVDELAPIVEELCEALTHAHTRASIVHRDLKPANLMLNSRGVLKVTDFGIARSLSDSVSMLSLRTSGTLIYMSPQQLDGERATPVDDIYSLGVTIYELLTGKPPFYTGGIDRQIRDKIPPPMSARRNALDAATAAVIPIHWETTIAACLAKDPARRPQSAAEVASRLILTAPDSERSAFPATAGIAPPVRVVEAVKPLKRNFAMLPVAILLTLTGGLLAWYFGFVLPKEAARKAKESRGTEAQTSATAAKRPANARGALLVNTVPSGATVSLGTQSYKSPTSFPDVPAGIAHLKILLDGYEPIEREVEITANQISDSGLIRLTRLVGSARVESVPESIEFDLIDADGGHHSGITPASLTSLPIGPAKVIYQPTRVPSHNQYVNVNPRDTVISTWRVPELPSPSPFDFAITPPAVTAPTPRQEVIAPATRETQGDYIYQGMVGPYEATFRLRFEPGERVSGDYTLPTSVNNGLVLRLTGRNPQGKLYLDEYTHDRLTAHIELTLNRSSTEIRWEGTMVNTPPDNRVFRVSFSRPRDPAR